MCNQFTFHHQFWIDIWRSKFEYEANSIFRSCWSYGRKSQRSYCDWLECTTSCTILAWCMEETSERSVLGRHQSCSEERLKFYQIQSNATILHGTLPIYCTPKVVGMESGEIIYESICVTSSFSQDLFDTRLERRIANSKTKSWQIGATRCRSSHENRARWNKNVKSTSPVTEKWLQKWPRELYNINTSNKDNNHDTNYINRNTDANHDTRKLHEWAQHVERAVSVRLDDCVIHTSLAQDVLESSSHPHVMHVWFSLIFTFLPVYFDLFFHTSTIWTPWNTTCAPARTRGVTTPTTSTPPS